jgi:hypothetical protein
MIMIPREIRNALMEKTGKTIRRIYQMIQEKKKEYKYTISKEMAAYILAAEKGIDISKILPEEELAKLRELRISEAPIIKKERKVPEQKRAPQQIVIDIAKEFRIVDPFLPKKLITEAIEMAKIYPIIYLFENSVRNLIRTVLGKKYGANWWDIKVPQRVKREVAKRTKKEKKNRWHGKRGAHEIFYTTIGELESIIVTNWLDFRNVFPNEAWIKSRIDEIEISRNIIAHNNPLSDRDIGRLKLYYEDWIRQVKECDVIKEMS